MKVFVSYAHTAGRMGLGAPGAGAKGGRDRGLDRSRAVRGGSRGRWADGWRARPGRTPAHLLERGPCRFQCLRARVAACPREGPGVPVGPHAPRPADGAALPAEVPTDLHQPLYIDLRDDSQPDLWQLLLRGCAAEFGTSAPAWLCARDEVADALRGSDP